MPGIKTIAETLKILVRNDCADSIKLRYEDGFGMEIGAARISVQPEHMTPLIINKLKDIYPDNILEDDRIQPSKMDEVHFIYNFEELAVLKNGGEVKREWDWQSKFSTMEISSEKMTEKEKNDKALIIYSGDKDIAILHFAPDGEVEIELLYNKYGIFNSFCRLHPAFLPNMTKKEQSEFLKSWLNSLLPTLPECDKNLSLYDKIHKFGYNFAGNLKIVSPDIHHIRVQNNTHDCFLNLSANLEKDKLRFSSSLFPNQDSGFAVTYVPEFGLYTQGFGIPDTHYAIKATERNRNGLIARLFALHMAKLMKIPAVDSFWHIQDEQEYLVMNRFDMRNGREIWRGRWWGNIGDIPVINPQQDWENFAVRKIINELVCDRENSEKIDLYEIVPTAYCNLDENTKRYDNQMRLAPYIGVTGTGNLENSIDRIKNIDPEIPRFNDFIYKFGTIAGIVAKSLALEFPEIADEAEKLGMAIRISINQRIFQ